MALDEIPLPRQIARDPFPVLPVVPQVDEQSHLVRTHEGDAVLDDGFEQLPLRARAAHGEQEPPGLAAHHAPQSRRAVGLDVL